MGESVPISWSAANKRAVHLLAVVTVVVALTYLGWRVTSTVMWSQWWISLPFLLLEAHLLFRMALTFGEVWDLDTAVTVDAVDSAPGAVVVLITTYDEGPEVLLPTIAAALLLQPAHETWVLDDGQRGEVAEMARELGARYVTRTSNSHAKAGNLNNALDLLDAEFVAVLDADHVPESNFLRHTLGYFDDPTVALVQTPQEFYNTDSFIHHGRSDRHDEQFFHRVVMAGKNRCNAAFWCGTNAVLRVSALNWVGGVSTATVTEDIHTSVRLHRSGWSSIHHNEVLARGLAPRNYDEFRTQRWRWGAGSMQSVAIENPLLSGGLSAGQRFMYGASALSWFDSWRTLFLHLVPPTVLLTGAVPVDVPLGHLALALVVVHLFHLVTIRIMSRGRLGILTTMVFEILKMPSNVSASLIYLRPRAVEFTVTPKGRTGSSRRRHEVPLLLWALLGLDVLGWAWATASLAGVTHTQPEDPRLVVAGVAWLLVNTTVLALAIDRIRQRRYGSERRGGHRAAVLAPGRFGGDVAMVDDISLSGASLVSRSEPSFAVGDEVTLEARIGATQFTLAAIVRQQEPTRLDGVVRFGVEFAAGQWLGKSALATGLLRERLAADSAPHGSTRVQV